ncbi:PAS domain-containing protein [Shewanella jiangmenensis]|uniref:PAS domain-containing protein n=1 Tax=Shewanella jiangmenensis TaxID=2837387 RepID=UPI002032D2E9|nr:PAS domain-containing protein [Shewanella jiangmenensis]
MRKNLPVTQKENDYPSDWILLSTTDTKSIIKYANPAFCKVAGYDLASMQGQPHNMVRHPDMPPQAFEDLWNTIKKGNPWKGLVKNRCANGDHYWVDAFVTPITHNGQIVEYQSVRT